MGELKLRDKLGVGDTTFGVEIEFDDALLENIKDAIGKEKNLEQEALFKYENWIVASETSITRREVLGLIGGEATSPVFKDEYKSYKEISDICEIIKALGGCASDLTAAHIHIGSDILEDNPKYLSNLIKLWISYEDIIYKFGYNGDRPRKSINSYAYPFYPYINELNKFYKCNSVLDILRIVGNERVYGINFKNYKDSYRKYGRRLNTIEVRCPNGTLDPIVWQNNINFFIKLFLYAKSESFDNKLINSRIKLSNYPSRCNDATAIFAIKDLSKATELSDMIFTDDIDKKRFIKQYKR